MKNTQLGGGDAEEAITSRPTPRGTPRTPRASGTATVPAALLPLQPRKPRPPSPLQDGGTGARDPWSGVAEPPQGTRNLAAVTRARQGPASSGLAATPQLPRARLPRLPRVDCSETAPCLGDRISEGLSRSDTLELPPPASQRHVPSATATASSRDPCSLVQQSRCGPDSSTVADVADEARRQLLSTMKLEALQLEARVPVELSPCQFRPEHEGVPAWSKCHPWQCPSSAPAAPEGAPGGSGQLDAPRVRPSHLAPSHRLGIRASCLQSRRLHCL